MDATSSGWFGTVTNHTNPIIIVRDSVTSFSNSTSGFRTAGDLKVIYRGQNNLSQTIVSDILSNPNGPGYLLQLENNSGFNLYEKLNVKGINFGNGIINTNNDTIFVNDSRLILNYDVSSYVNGNIATWLYPNSSNLNDPPGVVTFPIGDANNYRPISLDFQSSTINYLSKYTQVNFTNSSIYSSSFSGAITRVAKYYWKISDPSSSPSTKIKFDFDNNYGIDHLSSLAIVGYDGSNWVEIPSTVSGTITSGSIETTNYVTDFSNYYFTLASTNSNTNLLGNPAPKTYVPDDNFEAYLETHDASGNVVSVGDANSMGDGIANNDYVTTANISGVTFLDVNSQNIVDLTGIDDFDSLSILKAHTNSIVSLDFSSNINLSNLDVNNNSSLTSINLSNNVNLSQLSLSGCSQIGSIDLSNNINLTQLFLQSCGLTNIDVSQNNQIITLHLANNLLSAINLSNLSLLSELELHNNQIANLNLSSNQSLVV